MNRIMTGKAFQSQILCLITAALLVMASQPVFSTPQKVQKKLAPKQPTPSAKATRPVSSVLFVPPVTDQQPKQTVGAGSRHGDYCQPSSPQLIEHRAQRDSRPPFMALMPFANAGLTLSARPTFWVYVPPTTAKHLILSLRQQGLKQRMQTSFEISAGVMGLTLPNKSTALEVGKTYEWAAVLICGDQPSPNDPIIVSSISRVATGMPSVTSPLERAAVYGRNGIWFDALAELAQARRLQPDSTEPTMAWANFLRSAGLEIVASEPLSS